MTDSDESILPEFGATRHEGKHPRNPGVGFRLSVVSIVISDLLIIPVFTNTFYFVYLSRSAIYFASFFSFVFGELGRHFFLVSKWELNVSASSRDMPSAIPSFL